MKFKLLTFVVTFLFVDKLYSQCIKVGDSLKLSFEYSRTPKTIKTESDLNFRIVQTNISNKPIAVYSDVKFFRAPNIFGNLDCELYKKMNGKYTRIEHYIGSHAFGYYFDSVYAVYGSYDKTDSVLKLFDAQKVKILPSQADTLTFNLLRGMTLLEKGDYRLKILLRIATVYKNESKGLDGVDLRYASSGWFYFNVPKQMYSSEAHLNK